MKINKELLKECSELMNLYEFTTLEYSNGKESIKLSKNKIIHESKLVKATNENLDTSSNETVSDNSIKAPIVGTIYLKPEPGAKPFIHEGQNVKVGQVLLIIEAMKTMNEITYDREGIVKKIFVKDAAPVEFGEPLVQIE